MCHERNNFLSSRLLIMVTRRNLTLKISYCFKHGWTHTHQNCENYAQQKKYFKNLFLIFKRKFFMLLFHNNFFTYQFYQNRTICIIAFLSEMASENCVLYFTSVDLKWGQIVFKP